VRHSSPACPTLTPGCQRPPAVTTGFSHDLLLLCAAGDREGVERLASRLRNAGQRVAVEVMVEDFAPAVALADGLAQAAVVLLSLSERFQQVWSSEDIAALHQAEKTGRWLVLQLDGQEIPESWPAGVGGISWSPDDHGNSKRSRQALARIQALLDPSIPRPATEDTPADRRRKARDDFSSDVKRALYSRVGGYCSCPSCPNTTSGPHSDAAKATNTGVAAHISAAAPGGPRYNPSLTSEQRASAENGIWLCQICAKLIDNDPAAFPEALLLQWKKDAEQAALARQKGIAKSRHPGPRLPKHSPHNLPERTTTPGHFVGRDAQLEKLGELLTPPGSRVLLTGMGGVGKSELALQHAHAQLAYYRGGIVRVDARQGFEGMAAQVIAFVRGTFPELLPEKGPPEELLPLCWSQWPAAAAEPEPVLLLLDDLPSDADGAKSEERLCQGLPPRFRRLISRREKAPRNARSLDLERLQRPDALRLLSFHADGDEPNPRAQRDPEAADGLCKAVGDLPLALVLLGARLADRPDLPPKALLQELEAKGAEAKALLEAHPELGAKLGVVESLLISWAPLSAPAQELAVLLSLMAPAVIPWELVEGCRRDDQELVEGQAFGDAQAALLRAQLLERVGPNRYQLHPLVRQFVALQAREMGSVQEGWRKQLARAVAAICREKFDEVMPLERQAEVAAYVPHIVKVAEVDAEALAEDDLLWTFTALGRLSENQANFSDALVWDECCLEQCEQRLGPDHPNVAASLNNLAGLLRTTNRLAEAEPLMLRALTITEASYGPDHPEVAIDLNNLAGLLQDTNRLTEAEPLMRRALAISEASLGSEHPMVATALMSLAMLLKATNRLTEAEPLMLRALAIKEASYGPDHPDVARKLNNLALLLQATNRLAEAEPLMRRALAIFEASYGPDHPYVARYLNNLGTLLHNTNRLVEAEQLYRSALTIVEASFGPDHPEVAIDLNNLAGLLQDTNRLTEAEQLYRSALMIDEASFGPDHPTVAIKVHNLATLLYDANRLTEAEPLMRRALAIGEACYGPDDPKVVSMLKYLAGLLKFTNRQEEAESLMRRLP
jgi:tetratricopeptide (TPR) repeat protein